MGVESQTGLGWVGLSLDGLQGHEFKVDLF